MNKLNSERMVSCPYNRFHIVSKFRLQKHIVKCKKSYPNVKLAACFYNYAHRFKPEDMLEHYKICPQKSIMEYSQSYGSNDSSTNRSVINKPCKMSLPDITVKPKVFSSAQYFTPSPTISSGQESNFSDSKSKNDEIELESYSEKLLYDESECDDSELEPLPLPKTVSKAFRCEGSEVSLSGFGRGKKLLKFLKEYSMSDDQSLIDLNNREINKSSEMKNSIFSLKPNSCSYIASSVLDYEVILKSDDTSDEDNNINEFISEDFGKYVKI